jgi:hypothetical protein
VSVNLKSGTLDFRKSPIDLFLELPVLAILISEISFSSIATLLVLMARSTFIVHKKDTKETVATRVEMIVENVIVGSNFMTASTIDTEKWREIEDSNF